MRALVELANSGGYVCAQYFPQDETLVGYIAPNSKIELISGKWGSRSKRQGRPAILKGLSLQKVKVIEPKDSVGILAGRPRMGTIMRWPSAGKAIEYLVENRRGEPTLSDLSPAQQETLCSEFMRLPEATAFKLPNLAHLLLPTGRTLKDVDIYGIARDGKVIFAQVTYLALDHKQAKAKLDRLRVYEDRGKHHLIFFCQCPQLETIDGILVCPISSVFEHFGLTETGKTWLHHAFDWTDLK